MNWKARSSAIAVAVAIFLGAPGVSVGELMADNNIGRFTVKTVLNGKFALADPDGFTLYTYAKDPDFKSICNAACATAWPPVVAQASDRPFESFSVILRDDGQPQWAFAGKPLYRSAEDTAKGQANGQGIDDAWTIIEIAAHEM